jgi:hypothetical protein
MPQAFMSVASTAFPRISGRHRRARDEVFERPRSSQRGGSGTSRRIHSVTSAGSTPTKKTARQPHRGSTTSVTRAAIISPMAHDDCMSPRALPRCCAGQVSAMSAAPVVHSPPMPSPRMNRNTASWVIVWLRPQAKLARE